MANDKTSRDWEALFFLSKLTVFLFCKTAVNSGYLQKIWLVFSLRKGTFVCEKLEDFHVDKLSFRGSLSVQSFFKSNLR